MTEEQLATQGTRPESMPPEKGPPPGRQDPQHQPPPCDPKAGALQKAPTPQQGPPPAQQQRLPQQQQQKPQLPPPPVPRPKATGDGHFRRSESLAAFAPAMAKAQGEIGFAMKDTDNTFFLSKYADMASVVNAFKIAFAKHGLFFMQFPRATDEGIEVETLIMHESAEWVSDILSLPVMKIDPHGYGQGITYCCRYAIRSMVGVAPEEDDGNKPSEDVGKAREAALKALTEAAAKGPQAFETTFKELPMDVRKAIQRDLPTIREKIVGAKTPPQTKSQSAI